jgi:hypothetical protein
MSSRRIELVCGVLGGILGLAALGVGLFVPGSLVCYAMTHFTPTPGCFRVSLVQEQGLASLAPPIVLFGGLSLGVTLFAIWHSQTRGLLAHILLWLCTALLWGVTVLALPSIGLLFVPTDVLALVASIAGTVAAGQRAPAHV